MVDGGGFVRSRRRLFVASANCRRGHDDDGGGGREFLFFFFLRNKFNTRGFVIGSRAPHEMPRRSRKEESNKKDMKLVNIFQIKEEEIKKKPLF